MRAMALLGRPVDKWDDWFLEVVESKLDPSTREDWETSLEGKCDFPTYQEMVSFLENRASSLEAANYSDSPPPNMASTKSSSSRNSKSVSALHAFSGHEDSAKASRADCVLCRGKHFVGYCPSFCQYELDKKMSFVVEANLCRNCLRSGHQAAKCPSKGRCRAPNCDELHHTLLHPPLRDKASEEVSPSTAHVHTVQSGESIAELLSPVKQVTLLATAIITLESLAGAQITVRALLDPGAELSFITERVAQSLLLNRRKARVHVSGVGGEVTVTSKHSTDLILRPRAQSNFYLSFTAMILGKLTSLLPKHLCPRGDWPHLKGLELADPHFTTPAQIDCILGADLYHLLILEGLRKGRPQEPVAQKTQLG